MPKCLKCNTNNSIGRKTCKSCGQALIIEVGKACKVCGSINGPFAKKCKKCSEILKKVSTKKELNGFNNEQTNEFYGLLKSSYLYNHEKNTFAEEEFTVSFTESGIYFTLKEVIYEFENAEDFNYIFHLEVQDIPDFIKNNASRLIKPLFRRYGDKYKIRVLEDTLGLEEFVLVYANKEGKLVGTRHLPISEHEIEELASQIVESCEESKTYLCMYENEMFVELIDTMARFNYRYEHMGGNGKEFIYKIGDKNITIEIFNDGESLKLMYLNKALILTKSDREFISIILINWMLNIVIEPMTLTERMKQYFSGSTGILEKWKNYFNKNLFTSHYTLTEDENLVLNVVSENLIRFTFKEFKTNITQSIHPNMPYLEFEKILESYIELAKNKDFMQYIKLIEDSTKHSLDITDVSTSGCKIYVHTKSTLLSTFILNADTTYIEVTQFINKINFLEQIIGD